jgi:NAD-dependent dihydropyrimidine dehydrogenase PreA subunit
VDACAIGALQAGRTVVLDQQTCTGCAVCLHVCPTGALEADDGLANLLETAGLLRSKHLVELDCPQQSKPQRGPAADAVIRTDACLAVLGPDAYLSLLALGVGAIVARTDACAACPLNTTQRGAVERRIAQTLTTARTVLAAVHQDTRLVDWATVAGGEACERPVCAPSGARVSRRDFLRVFTGKPQDGSAPATAGDQHDLASPALKTPPRQRRRLLGALKMLAAEQPIAAPGALPESVFPLMAASDACTACGVCARVCPTGAMKMTIHFDETYQLSFLSAACTNCGECLDLCDYEALRVAGAAELPAVLAMQPTILRQGEMLRCDRCNSRFASAEEAGLCPVCSFRVRNPFSSRLPPSLERRMAREGKQL